jgi:photosystem II stability/assembly factor-like uncharacterized protein
MNRSVLVHSFFLISIFAHFTFSSIIAQVIFTKHLIDGNFMSANGVYSTDVNQDGYNDIIGSAMGSNEIAWWQNDGSQNFAKHIIDTNFISAISVSSVDIDGDGDKDILAGKGFEGNEIAWWENDGIQEFQKHVIDSDISEVGRLYSVDLDGDGDMDISGSAFGGNSINWWENDGHQNFTRHLIEENYMSPFDSYPKDIDSDGDIDILGSAGDGNTIDWWENYGNQNFTRHIVENNLNSPRHTYAADLDRDGDVDVLGTEGAGQKISWFENDGQQNFTKHLVDGSFGPAFDVHAADINGDGEVDIIGASIAPGTLAWWKNNGDRTFTKNIITINFGGANCVNTIDIDGDGDLDVLATGEFSNQIAWFENSLNTPGQWQIQIFYAINSLLSVKAVSPSVAWVEGLNGTVLRTTNGGTTWTSASSDAFGTDYISSIEAIDENTAFVSYNPGLGSTTHIFRTTNGGVSWNSVFEQTPGSINSIRMIDAYNGIAIGDPSGGKWTVLKTSDGGSTWVRINTEPPQINDETGSNPKGIFVIGSTNIWFTSRAGRVYRSTDSGVAWNYSAIPFSGFLPSMHFNDTQYGMVGNFSGTNVARTTDGGVTWTSVTLPNSDAVRGISGSGIDFYVDKGFQILHSIDRGITWSVAYNGGIGSMLTSNSFVVHDDSITGWIVTNEGGILRYDGKPTPITVTDIEEKPIESPSAFRLEQNYPNPFNPSTVISYQLSRASQVSLKIYNILGKEVAVLVNGEKSAGSYQFSFDASGLSSGIYFYRIAIHSDKLQAGNFTESKKMIVLK